MNVLVSDARRTDRAPAVPPRPPGPTPSRATAVPAWFLLPGLGLLLASLGAYAQYQRTFPANGFDLEIYRQAVRTFLAGRDVYGATFTGGLPYTYPPVTLALLTPLTWLDGPGALLVLMAVTVVAAFLTAWSTSGLLGHRGVAGRLGVAGAVTGVAMWLEPFASGMDLGQVNAVLMLLVVADLALPDRSRLKGAGVGLAAAAKLVPAIFVVHLLLTRRTRAAGVAVGAFLLTTLVGCLVAPRQSAAFWLHGLFLDPSRVTAMTGPAFVGNQSLRGMVLRTLGDSAGAGAVWVLAVLLVGVSGLALAVLAHRRAEEAVAVAAVAFTAVLVCPVSWSHHWVWVVVLLPVLVDVVLRVRGRAQVLAAGLLPLWAVVLLVWPLRAKPGEVVSTGGLIWVAYRQEQPVRWLAQNLYVLAALGTMVLAAWWLRGRRRGASGAVRHDAAPRPAGESPAGICGQPSSPHTSRRSPSRGTPSAVPS